MSAVLPLAHPHAAIGGQPIGTALDHLGRAAAVAGDAPAVMVSTNAVRVALTYIGWCEKLAVDAPGDPPPRGRFAMRMARERLRKRKRFA